MIALIPFVALGLAVALESAEHPSPLEAYGARRFPPQQRKSRLPPLPYAENALEPQISAATVRMHHDQLQAGYVRRTNALLEHLNRKTGSDRSELQLWRDLAYQASGARLHQLYWDNLTPGGSRFQQGPLQMAIQQDFGSIGSFLERFNETALAVPGSGWVVLAWVPSLERLVLLAIDQHQRETMPEWVPLLVCDVWEHAYVLDYGSDRAAYMRAFWHLVNWPVVERRFAERGGV